MPVKPKSGESKQKYIVRCIQAETDKGTDGQKAASVCNASWSKANQNLGEELRDMELLGVDDGVTIKLAKKEGEEKPGFLMVAYTGAPITRFWGQLVIDISGMQMKETMPTFREHMRDRIVGTINKNWKDDNALFASGVFHEVTADGKEVLDLLDDDFPWQASIGVRALKIMELPDSKSSMVVNGQTIFGPADVWVESKVNEVSFVALGADDQTVSVPHREEEGPFSAVIERVNAQPHENLKENVGKSNLEVSGMEWLQKILEDALPGEENLRTLLTTIGVKEDALDGMVCVFKVLEAHKDKIPEGLFTLLAQDGNGCEHWASPVQALQEKVDELEAKVAASAGAQGNTEQIAALMTEIAGLRDTIQKMKKAGWEKEVRVRMTPLRLPGIDKEKAIQRVFQLGAEDAQILLTSYEEISKAAGTDGAFTELGGVGETDQDSTALGQLQSKAEARAKEKGITVQKAWTEVLRENPKLYAEYSDALITTQQGDD